MMAEERDTSSATWKFEFFRTVNADPQANGVCLGVIVEFLNYCSKGDPRAYRSLPDLMIATGSTRPTVRKAIRTLISLKYLDPLFVTEGGATMYRLVNARKEMIDDHVHISKVSLAGERAERKRQERKAKRGKETCPPDHAFGERNLPPIEKESFPNTVELHRRASCSEVGAGLIEDIDLLASSPPDDPAEARRWLTAICADRTRLAEALTRWATGNLTNEFLREIAA